MSGCVFVCYVQVNCNKFHTIEWFLSAFEINVINEVAYFIAQRRPDEFPQGAALGKTI